MIVRTLLRRAHEIDLKTSCFSLHISFQASYSLKQYEYMQSKGTQLRPSAISLSRQRGVKLNQASAYSSSLQHRWLCPQIHLLGKFCLDEKEKRKVESFRRSSKLEVQFQIEKVGQGSVTSSAAYSWKAKQLALLNGCQNPWRRQALLKSAVSFGWRVKSYNGTDKS